MGVGTLRRHHEKRGAIPIDQAEPVAHAPIEPAAIVESEPVDAGKAKSEPRKK